MPTRRKQSPSRATPKRSPAKKRTQRAAKRPAASRVPVPHPVGSAPSLSDRFPIVGMGASAGGLEALEAFFTHMPSDSGMAFVVLTHQPPQHVSLLPDLLGRYTTMPVLTAGEGMKLAPNRIYIAPANRYLSVLHATLHELDATQGESLQFPIDMFFRALAKRPPASPWCRMCSRPSTTVCPAAL
jgi:two-component system CheB/CheR fusion protein